MNIKQASEYWDVAQRISQRHSSNRVITLLRIILCRLIHGLGPQDYVLYDFHHKSLMAPSNYLTKAELEGTQRKINPVAACELVDDKLEYFCICKEKGIPTPVILALIDSTKKEDVYKSIPIVNSANKLLSALTSQGNGLYILKKLSGSHGAGIIRIAFNQGKVEGDGGVSIDLEQLMNEVLASNASYIVQKSLLPHPALKSIMPGIGLGTTRIVTMNMGGNIKIFTACVRMPVGTNIADNFSHGKAKNLIANANIESGKLDRAFGPDPLGLDLVENVLVHPDSEQAVEGFEFPFWDEMKETAIEGAKVFSDLRTIGWDVALTEEGPCLIEANWRYDCDIHQVALSQGLKGSLLKELAELTS